QTRGIWMIDKHFADLDNEKRKTMIRVFSSDRKGAEVLLKLFRSGYLNSSLFDDDAVNRIVEITSASVSSLVLKTRFDNNDKTEDVVLRDDLESYLTIVRKIKGDVARGRQLFNACLLCHRVGDAGQDLAPALDGSKNRTE